jgi:hypothetical protein
MQNLRRHTDNADAAQRYAADEAGREQAALDPRSVLLAVKQWIANGEIERARAYVAEYKKGLK